MPRTRSGRDSISPDEAQEDESQPLLTQPSVPPVKEDDDSETEDENALPASGATVVVKTKTPSVVKDILTDVVEYAIEMIFLDRERREEHIEVVKYFFNLHPAKAQNSGRIFIRKRLSDVLVDACSREPYEDDSKSKNGLGLAHWGAEDWEELIDDLREIRDLCIRKDATTNTTGRNSTDSHPEREVDDCFSRRFEMVLKLCELHKVLSPVRATLERQLDKDAKGQAEVKAMQLEEVRALLDDIKQEEVGGKILDLFVVNNSQKKLALKSLPELFEKLKERPFDLTWFQSKLENLLQKWNTVTFGKEDPVLVRKKYRIAQGSVVSNLLPLDKDSRRFTVSPIKTSKSSKGERGDDTVSEGDVEKSHQTKEGSNKEKFYDAAQDKADAERSSNELKRLRKNRDKLNNGHGEDPKEPARALAEEATGVARKQTASGGNPNEENEPPTKKRKGSGQKKPSAARQLSFMDDIWEDDEKDERERVELSDIPNKSSSHIPKTYFGPPPDNGVFAPDGRVVKRRLWTSEEKNAVKVGVQKHGLGKWVAIKSDYPEILRNRTAVQIKDVWRTMTRNNEIDFGEVFPNRGGVVDV